MYWYDRDANRYPTPYEQIELERQRADDADLLIERERQQTDRERQRAERLAAQLRALGIEPD
ncbi:MULTISPECIES: hypothetical protein [unclassified Chamaesiphon]|uniref:hypothetical protein n=1 Tax=unclassified Chamaesiphon TaxID=2620921 RepID=UPI00286C4FA4|nr:MULTISPECIES: hypothetical protein [unclassified Chamaesiphon]